MARALAREVHSPAIVKLDHASASIALIAALGGIPGCGAQSVSPDTIDAGVAMPSCTATAPTCVAPGGDPCGAPSIVAAVCDAATDTWQCPMGARPHARAPSAAGVCHPFEDTAGPIENIGGSLVRVPTDDGRCVWVAESVRTRDGVEVSNVALVPDLTAPFGTCPSSVGIAPAALVTAVHIESGEDPTLHVQIATAYRIDGVSRVIYRLFRDDPSAAFGVDDLGGGIGRWDAATQQIVVPGPDSIQFSVSLGLGDASLVEGDQAFVWGCPPPPDFLTDHCLIARTDATDAIDLFTSTGTWNSDAIPSDAARVFDAGPWISSVTRAAGGGLTHVYAVGFGTTLEAHRASVPQGPWSDGPTLAQCDLPHDDASAFCAGPIVHEELADPTRAGETVVSYGVGTTSTTPSDSAGAYATRLAWIASP